MKRSIPAAAVVLGLAGVSGTVVAQSVVPSVDLRRVTVTASPGQYENYAIALGAGYALHVRVGNTHRQYMEALRATESSETLRREGRAPAPFVAVALDNASAPGLARQVRLVDRAQNTLAIVDVYCKRLASDAGNHCRLIGRPVAGDDDRQSLASLPQGRLELAQIGVLTSR